MTKRSIRENNVETLTVDDFRDWVEFYSELKNVRYNTHGDVSNSNVVLLSPTGDTYKCDTKCMHDVFVDDVAEAVRKSGRPFADRTWNGNISDYLMCDLGFITLNSGLGPCDDRCKICFGKRPTARQIAILVDWLNRYYVDKNTRLWLYYVHLSKYVGTGHTILVENEYSAKDVIRIILRAVSTGVFTESLKEGVFLDEDKTVLYSTSPYEVKNYLLRNDHSYRIAYDPKTKYYLVGKHDNTIHRELVYSAIEQGLYPGFRTYQVDRVIEDNDILHIIYAPKGKEKDTYGSELGEDGYDELYEYPFGTITTRWCDWKDCPLSKAFGKYVSHKGIKWNEDKWKNDVVELESLNEVYPDKDESKDDFISRFMSVTKDEYPDAKQRYAVALSYWNRKNKKNEAYEPVKTGKAYKVFKVKNGELYPPMVANKDNASTPIGVWLDAEEGEFAGLSKTGRPQVKSTGGGTLSYRPGWHLGDVPRAPQFDRLNKATGEYEFPKDFVWVECEYAMDVDYQKDADERGYERTKVDDEGNVVTTRGDKYQHSLAGLSRLPDRGYYRYRTNPRPDTVPWVITGQMKVNRLLSDDEVNDILKSKGIEPIHRQGGDKTLAELGLNESLIESKKELKRDKTGREYHIWTECTGGGYGQSDYMKIAYVGDDWMDEHDRIIRENILGYLQYAVSDDEEDVAYVQMIEVKDVERRKGIASALMDSLNADYKEVYWGFTTDDGTKFKKAYMKEEIAREVDNEGHELSAEQSEFFKNSKVRDAKGRLVVCYHSTGEDFDVFDKDKAGKHGAMFGSGFYFSTHSDNIYAYGGKYKRCYLNIVKPYYQAKDNYDDELAKKLIETYCGEFDEKAYEFDPLGIDYSVTKYIKSKTGKYVSFKEVLIASGYDGIIVDDYDDIESRHTEIVAFEPNQIKSIDNRRPTDRDNINESLLVEKKRGELISKSKNADAYAPSNRSRGKNRWERRRYSQVMNSVRDYNQINMDAFWKGDILEFGVKVHGETDDYVVTVTFEKILDNLRDEVKANNDKMEFKCVLRALLRSFNEDDLYISCSCPDWRYRMSYQATKGQYNSGLPELRPSDITNPHDTKGAGCKHSLLVLSNTDWMMKIASVINNYVKYCKNNMARNYADYIFPQIYGVPYKKAVQLSLFDDMDSEYSGLLPSDQKARDDVIAMGMKGKDEKGRFQAGNEYRFAKTRPEREPSIEDENPLGLKFGNDARKEIDYGTDKR